MNFVTIDVETANADLSSICQIGLAKYEDGKLVEEWTSLVNPEDYFDSINISIHGINEKDVAESPTFPEVAKIIERFITQTVCVSHTHFDRVSITRTLIKYELPPFDTVWLDSAKVARRTWKEFANKGYGLKNICDKIGYSFNHHDALEDAKACGFILLAAIKETELEIDKWIKRVNQPIFPGNLSGSETHRRKAIKRDGNQEGEMFGEVLVFTGALQVPRKEAAELAANAGCSVDSSVTSKTTLLVVGDQDISKLAGKDKSSKHLKAEQLIKKGQSIRILKESDFIELIGI